MSALLLVLIEDFKGKELSVDPISRESPLSKTGRKE